MPSYLHPGVYVEEIPGGSKPIEGVGTSTAAFVGYTTRGPIGEPTLISKWDEYDETFGGIRNLQKQAHGDPMGLSVSAFFLNGGTKAYIVRITEDIADEDVAAIHAIKAEGYVDHPLYVGNRALKFTAVNEGEWANKFVIKMAPNSLGDGSYDIEIGEEEEDSRGNLVFSANESFTRVNLDSEDPLYFKNVVDGVSDLVTIDEVADISLLNIISDMYIGSSTSGDLGGVSLDLSGESAANRKFKITVDNETQKTVTIDANNYTDLTALSEHIQEKVRGIDTAKECYSNFTCTTTSGNKLVLTSGSRQTTSAVKIKHDFGIAPAFKLGVALYEGSSTSSDLGGGFSLALSDAVAFPDAESRSLKGTIDGQAFGPDDLGTSDLANIGAIATEIAKITGVSCTAVGNTLKLVSDTAKSFSSVVIESDFGIAPSLLLGLDPENHGGTEITGQEFHENSLSIGFSASADLDPAISLTLSDAVQFPDADSRSIEYALDGAAVTKFDLGAADLADIAAIATAIDGATDLSCVAIGNKLHLTSDLVGATSSLIITSDFGLAPVLQLGVVPDHHGGMELSGTQNKVLNFRTELAGQEYADIVAPKDRLNGGVDGGEPKLGDYEAIFTKFIKYRDINIICLPGQHWTADSSGNSVIQAAIGHASNMKNRMVILDPPPSHELTNEKMVNDMGLPSQTYCVSYYPWIKVANRFYDAERAPGLPKNVLVQPGGYAAGMWGKIDGKRGVWKAAAGTETGLLGLSALEYPVEDSDQDSLNPWGVNCLRRMPGAGPVIWGARTLATKADPEWRYVPIRRTAIMIEQSIYQGIQWAVFEPNDHRLWSALRANIGNFMNGLFRAGAFQGEKASDAYFVRCGLGDTMTQGEIDAGKVITIVGFAPLKPAEFVIVRIQQKVNQQ